MYINLLALFLEGVLSFFSPCVLPLIPVYMSYLTQNAKMEDENGNISYKRSVVLLTTLFFVLGICTVFFVIASSISILKDVISIHNNLFVLFGGILIIFFGLISLKVINIPILDRKFDLPINVNLKNMNYLTAYMFGVVFSFSWSPCIGPLLASVVIKAATTGDKMLSFYYVLVYTFGFILMFLLLALFTSSILDLLKKYQSILKKATIIAGSILIFLGFNMVYNSSLQIIKMENSYASVDNRNINKNTQKATQENEASDEEKGTIEKYNFTLKNYEGKNINLTDYKGKTLLLTFYGTWCTYCNQELPLLQKLNDERDDINVLLIATPNDGREKDKDYIHKFMKQKGYDLPVLFDEDFSVKKMYNVVGYPTTYVFKADGEILGYIPGFVNEKVLNEILEKVD